MQSGKREAAFNKCFYRFGFFIVGFAQTVSVVFSPFSQSATASQIANSQTRSPSSESQELNNLKLKVDELSAQVKKMNRTSVSSEVDVDDDSASAVQAFLGNHLTLGGFFESSLSGLWGPDTRTHIASLNHALGLNFAARFSDEFRFVGQVLTALNFPLLNPHGDPRAAALGLPESRRAGSLTATTIPTQGYVEYIVSDFFRFQGGLGYSPFGYAVQQRELVLFVRRGGPQIMRTKNLVDPLWTGLHVHGSQGIRKHQLGYNVYTYTPTDYLGLLGTGFRFWWSGPREILTLGISSQVGKRGHETTQTMGLDVKWKIESVTFLLEYARKFMRGDQPWSVNLEQNSPFFSDNVLFYTFADYANSSLNRTGNGTGALADPYRKLEYGAGINWLPTSYTRFRAGLVFQDYVGDTAKLLGQNRDFTLLDLSVGVAF